MPFLGTGHCTSHGESVSMGMDRKNDTGKWQQRGNCGSAAEGRRGSRDNRQDADVPNATLVLVIPI